MASRIRNHSDREVSRRFACSWRRMRSAAFRSSAFYNSWTLACEDAGVPLFELHGLRHIWATTLWAGGLDLADVQELVGHTTARTTERYAIPRRRSWGPSRSSTASTLRHEATSTGRGLRSRTVGFLCRAHRILLTALPNPQKSATGRQGPETTRNVKAFLRAPTESQNRLVGHRCPYRKLHPHQDTF